MHDFAYHRPHSLEQARALFTANADARYLAGGQSLIPMMKHRLVEVGAIVDLGTLPGLSDIRVEQGRAVIGALARHADVASHPELHRVAPGLAELAGGIGDRTVRNRGTIGGAIAHNDPAGDYPAAVLALGATIHTNQRMISADAFFTGMFETALAEDEIITAIEFPIPERATYLKFPSPASRYAVVGVMIARTSRGVRVAVTGAGLCAFRAFELEEALNLAFRPDVIDGIPFDPKDLNDDLHASAEYRAHLIGVLAKRVAAILA